VKSVENAFARAKDAAATLDKIESQRNKENAKQQNRVMPARAPAAAMPAPPKRAMADEEMLSPEQMREQHDRAMRNFPTY
jgi:hypothetical protein